MNSYVEKLNKFIISIKTEYLVFVLAFLYRFPNITSFVNDDDSLWKYRGYEFTTAMVNFNFADTAITYHPGVPLLWSQMLAIKTYSVFDKLYFHGTLVGSTEFFYNHLIQNIYLLTFNSLLITFIFIFLRKVINEKYAIIALLVIMLEPFFIALGRSIHNDLLMSLFVFLTFLIFFQLMETYEKGNLYRRKMTWLMGIFSAMALLTKSGALFMVPLFICTVIVFAFFDFKSIKRYLNVFIAWLLLSVLFFVIIWPAMWVNPGHTLWLYFYKGIFDTAIEDGHLHYWFGEITMDPGFLFYPIVLVGRYTPVIIVGAIGGLVLFVATFFKHFKSKTIDKMDKFLLLNLVFFAGYFVMVSITSKKLDRYLLPEVFPLGVFTAYFVMYWFNKYRKYTVIAIVIFIILRGITIAQIHPNYLVYYSPFIGGNDKGRFVIEPKWVIGFDKVADFLNAEQAKSGHKLLVVTPDAHILSYFAKFEPIYPDNPESRRGEYFVIPIWKPRSAIPMLEQYELTPDQLATKVYIGGVEYYDIYKK
ncbi:MAG: phospholipid carrier-dependent glycosyltransferase [Thermosphaera sp.]